MKKCKHCGRMSGDYLWWHKKRLGPYQENVCEWCERLRGMTVEQLNSAIDMCVYDDQASYYEELLRRKTEECEKHMKSAAYWFLEYCWKGQNNGDV